MESPPGFEAQVDFGTGAPVIGPDGRRRKTHVLRVVLSHSRRGSSEAVFTQSTDDFIRCLENTFEHFGGVPHTNVIDNLKAGVLKADWFDPEINPKLEDFRRHYGTVVLPTKPGTPRQASRLSHLEFLDLILQDEVAVRDHRKVDRLVGPPLLGRSGHLDLQGIAEPAHDLVA